jgi:hypothetical protein
MDSHEMMAAGMDHGDAMEGLTGPYSELEVEVRVALIEGLRGQRIGRTNTLFLATLP